MKDSLVYLAASIILFSGCAEMQYATLNSAPTDMVLLSMKNDQYHRVIGSVGSDVQEPYVVTANDGGQVTVDLNGAFESQYMVYLRTKFYNFTTDSSAAADSTYFITCRLLSANTTYRYDRTPFSMVGEARAECTLVVNISVKRNGILLGQTTVTAPSSSNTGATWRETLGTAMNDAISKAIIMSDKYTGTLGL